MNRITLIKSLFIFVILLSFASKSFSQTSLDGMKYQAIVRDASGNVVGSQPIGMKFTIYRKTPVPVIAYVEEHSVNTNQLGLVNLEIGLGNATTGVFNNIDWDLGTVSPYYILVELDVNDGNGFQEIGESKLLAVPYALYTKFAQTAVNVQNETQDLQLSGNDLTISGLGAPTIINLAPYLDNTDAQVLSFNAVTDSLKLTNGGSVYLGKYAIDTELKAFMAKYKVDSANFQNQITGNSNEITSIKSRLSNLGDSMAIAYDSLGNYNTRIDTNAARIGRNSTNISNNTTDIQTLNAGAYKDSSNTNELITSMTTSNDSLVVTEGGVTTKVDLSGLSSLPQDLDSVLSVGNDARNQDITNVKSIVVGGTTTEGNQVTILDSAQNTNTSNYTSSLKVNSQGTATTGVSQSGVYSEIAGTKGENIAVDGTSSGKSTGTNTGTGGYARGGNLNRGVHGYADSANISIGLHGQANKGKKENMGVVGTATNGDTLNAGVYGQAVNGKTSNQGVFGYASGSAGSNHGVEGLVSDTNSTAGNRGVMGAVNGQGVWNEGVAGFSNGTNSTSNTGVLGRAFNSTGENNGVIGRASTPTTGFNNGVSGYASYGNDNIGVRGVASGGATTGLNYGVYGQADSSGIFKRGVVGVLAGSSDFRDAAIYGIANGKGRNTSIYGRANNSNPTDTNISFYADARNASVNIAGWFQNGAVYVDDTLFIRYGAQNNYVLTSDANGKAEWKAASVTDASDTNELITSFELNSGWLIIGEGNGSKSILDSVNLNGYVDTTTFNTYKSLVANNLVDSMNVLRAEFGNDTTQLADSDNNTRILTEKNTNEDVIRFETNGTEQLSLGKEGTLKMGQASALVGDFADTNYRLVINESTNSGQPHGIKVVNNSPDTMDWSVGLDVFMNGTTKSDPIGVSSQLTGANSNKISKYGYWSGITTSNQQKGFAYYSTITPSGTSDTNYAFYNAYALSNSLTYGFYSINEKYNYFSGKVGIGKQLPSFSLDVAGKIRTDSLQIVNGAQNNYILTSDAQGNATWKAPAVLINNDNDSTNELLDSIVMVNDTTFLFYENGVSKALSLAGLGGKVYTNRDSIQTLNTNIVNLELAVNSGAYKDSSSTNEVIDTTYITGNILTIEENGVSFTTDLSGISDDTTRIADGSSKLYVNGTDSSIRVVLNGTERYRITTKSIIPFVGNGSIYIGEDAGQQDSLFTSQSEANVGIGQNALKNALGRSGAKGVNNVAVGTYTLESLTTGESNVAIGSHALKSSTTGNSNTAVGTRALTNTTTGGSNTAVGQNSQRDNTTGSNNTSLGNSSLVTGTTGDNNVSVGAGSMELSSTGSNNTVVGTNAGNALTGSGNVMLGNNAGNLNPTASGKLYIDNSNSATPLIYGDFSNDTLKFNGVVYVRDELLIDQDSAQSGKVLTADANGIAKWKSLPVASVNNDNDSTNELLDSIVMVNDTTFLFYENGVSKALSLGGLGEQVYTNKDSIKTINTNVVNLEAAVNGGAYKDSSATNELVDSLFLNGSDLIIVEAGGTNMDTVDLSAFSATGDSTRIALNSGIAYIDAVDSALVIEKNGTETYRLYQNHINTAVGNVYVGSGAGNKDGRTASNIGNTGVGHGALSNVTTGTLNTAFGFLALRNNNGGTNTAIGYSSLEQNTSGNSNVTLGAYTLYDNKTGSSNTAVGQAAGQKNLGSKNVFIGNQAGSLDTNGSDKLYIDNSSTSSPLIYGDFANDTLKLNGVVYVRDGLLIDQDSAQTGKVLTADADGVAKWKALPTSTTYTKNGITKDNDTLTLGGNISENVAILIDESKEFKIESDVSSDYGQISMVTDTTSGGSEITITSQSLQLNSIEDNNTGVGGDILLDAENSANVVANRIDLSVNDSIDLKTATTDQQIHMDDSKGISLSSDTQIHNNAPRQYLESDSIILEGNVNLRGDLYLDTANANSGKVLTSDGNGKATWQNAAAGYTTKGIDSVLAAGNDAGGDSIVNLGALKMGYTPDSASVMVRTDDNFSMRIHNENASGSEKKSVWGSTAGSGSGKNFGLYGGATGSSTLNYGVFGLGEGSAGSKYGVFGQATGSTGANYAIYGEVLSGGSAANDYAGYFTGAQVYMSDKLGIGTTAPDSTLTINGGLKATYFTLTDSAGSGKVLTSDADGRATWKTPASASLGDTTQIADLDGNTRVRTMASTDEITFTTSGFDRWKFTKMRLEPMNTIDNVLIGIGAGQSMDTSGASRNGVALGNYALNSNSTGVRNTAIGNGTMRFNTTGGHNTALGYQSARSNNGSFNASMGVYSMWKATAVSNSVAIGYQSLYNNLTGDGNIAIGYQSAFNETGSDKLYIENSNSSSPLIYGDFDKDSLRFNGNVLVGGSLTLDTGNAVSGRVLTSDGNGKATWQNLPSGGDTLGNHIMTQNLETNGNYISNDGDDEGLFVTSDGNVVIGRNTTSDNFQVWGKTTDVTVSLFSQTGTSELEMAALGTGSSNKISVFRSRGVWPSFSSVQTGDDIFTLEISPRGTTASTVTNALEISVAGATGNDIATEMRFSTVNTAGSNNTNLFIGSEGNVGLGTTFPSEKLHVDGNVRINDTLIISTGAQDGKVLTSDGSGHATWQNAAGGAFQFNGTDASIYSDSTQHDFVVGSTQLDDLAGGDDNRRMLFDKGTYSFRVGLVNGTEWNSPFRDTGSSVLGGRYNWVNGNYSTIAGGNDNTISSENGFIGGGSTNTVSGNYSFLGGGENNIASGEKSFIGGGSENTASALFSSIGGGNENTASAYATTVAGGQHNIASGSRSTVSGGLRNQAQAENSFVGGGIFNRAQSYGEHVLGIHNDTLTSGFSTNSFVATDRLFVIGNGTSNNVRNNALVMLKNGNTILNGKLTLSSGSDSITLPNTDGISGQVLQTDGSGNVTWQTPAASSSSVWDTNSTTTFQSFDKNLHVGFGDSALSSIQIDSMFHFTHFDAGGSPASFISQNMFFDGTNPRFTKDGPAQLIIFNDDGIELGLYDSGSEGDIANGNADYAYQFDKDGLELPEQAGIVFSDTSGNELTLLVPESISNSDYSLILPADTGAIGATLKTSGGGVMVWEVDTLVCPSGFEKANKSFCIDKVERTAATWFAAVEDCGDEDAELATYTDWYFGAKTLSLTNPINNGEWVSNISQNNMMVVGNGAITTRAFQDPTLTATYRCVFRKP